MTPPSPLPPAGMGGRTTAEPRTKMLVDVDDAWLASASAYVPVRRWGADGKAHALRFPPNVPAPRLDDSVGHARRLIAETLGVSPADLCMWARMDLRACGAEDAAIESFAMHGLRGRATVPSGELAAMHATLTGRAKPLGAPAAPGLTLEQAVDWVRRAGLGREIAVPVGARLLRPGGYELIAGADPFQSRAGSAARPDPRLVTADGQARHGFYTVSMQGEADVLEDALSSATTLEVTTLDDVFGADPPPALLRGVAPHHFPLRLLPGGQVAGVPGVSSEEGATAKATAAADRSVLEELRAWDRMWRELVDSAGPAARAAQEAVSADALLLQLRVNLAPRPSQLSISAAPELLYEMFAGFRVSPAAPFCKTFDGARADFKVHRGALRATETEGGLPLSVLQRWTTIAPQYREPFFQVTVRAEPAGAGSRRGTAVSSSARSAAAATAAAGKDGDVRNAPDPASKDVTGSFAQVAVRQNMGVLVTRSYPLHAAAGVEAVARTLRDVNHRALRPLQKALDASDAGVRLCCAPEDPAVCPAARQPPPALRRAQVRLSVTLNLHVRASIVPPLSVLTTVLDRMCAFFVIVGMPRAERPSVMLMYRRVSTYGQTARAKRVAFLMQRRPRDVLEHELKTGLLLGPDAAAHVYAAYVSGSLPGGRQWAGRADRRADTVPFLELRHVGGLGFQAQLDNAPHARYVRRIAYLLRVAVVLAAKLARPGRGPAPLAWVDDYKRRAFDAASVPASASALPSKTSSSRRAAQVAADDGGDLGVFEDADLDALVGEALLQDDAVGTVPADLTEDGSGAPFGADVGDAGRRVAVDGAGDGVGEDGGWTQEDDDDLSQDGAVVPKTYMLRLLQRADPRLFLPKATEYSTYCAVPRQPIMVTAEELAEIDRKHPGAHTGAVAYGSTPQLAARNRYICPAVWCPRSRVALSPKGKDECPLPGEKAVRFDGAADDGSSGGKRKKYFKTESSERHVGFLSGAKHPDRLCQPCCFHRRAARVEACGAKVLTTNDAPRSAKEDAAAADGHNDVNRYLRSWDTVPLDAGRYGLLPPDVAVRLAPEHGAMCGSRPDGTGHANVRTACFVRRGVEPDPRAFLRCAVDCLQNPAVPDADAAVAAIRRHLDPATFVALNAGQLCRSMMRPVDPTRVRAEGVRRWLEAYPAYVRAFALQGVLEELRRSHGKHHASSSPPRLSAPALREAAVQLAMQAFLDALESGAVGGAHHALLDLLSRPLPWINPRRVNLLLLERAPPPTGGGSGTEGEGGGGTYMVCPVGGGMAGTALRLQDPIAFINRIGRVYEPVVHIIMHRARLQMRWHVRYEEDVRVRALVDGYLSACDNSGGDVGQPVGGPRSSPRPSVRLLAALGARGVGIRAQVLDFSLRLGGLVLEGDVLVPLTHLTPPEPPLVGAAAPAGALHLSEAWRLRPRVPVARVRALLDELASAVGDGALRVSHEVRAGGKAVALQLLGGGVVPVAMTAGAPDYLADLNVFVGTPLPDARAKIQEQDEVKQAERAAALSSVVRRLRRDAVASAELRALRSPFYPLDLSARRAAAAALVDRLARAPPAVQPRLSQAQRDDIIDTVLHSARPLSLRAGLRVNARGAELFNDADIATGWLERSVSKRVSALEELSEDAAAAARRMPVAFPGAMGSASIDGALASMSKASSTSAASFSAQGGPAGWMGVVRTAPMRRRLLAALTEAGDAKTAALIEAAGSLGVRARRGARAATHPTLLHASMLQRYLPTSGASSLLVPDVRPLPLMALVHRLVHGATLAAEPGELLQAVRAALQADLVAAGGSWVQLAGRLRTGAVPPHPLWAGLLRSPSAAAPLGRALLASLDRPDYDGGLYDVRALAPLCGVDVLLVTASLPKGQGAPASSRGASSALRGLRAEWISRRQEDDADSHKKKKAAADHGGGGAVRALVLHARQGVPTLDLVVRVGPDGSRAVLHEGVTHQAIQDAVTGARTTRENAAAVG